MLQRDRRQLLSRSPSLRTIAASAGVHRATVSLALRNHPRIPAATCQRIQKIAADLGYRPNPVVARAMRLVRGNKNEAGETIAWLNSFSNEDSWRTVPWLRGYCEGARERALSIGYGFDEIWLRAPGITRRRVAGILNARGIRGVLVTPPHEQHGRIHIDWSRLSVVGLDWNLLHPVVDRVCPDFFGNTWLAARNLRRSGCTRIGLWIGRYQDIVSRHLIVSAFLGWQAGRPSREIRIAPMVVNLDHAGSSRLFARWFAENRPDAVICIDGVVAAYAAEAGLVTGRDVRLAHLNLHPGCGINSGIDPRHHEIGAVAVDMLAGNLAQSRTGEPEVRREILIPGTWVPGP